MLQALIFDVDGTLADTEAAHRAAFNQAFDQEGLDWHWDEALYTQLLDVSGGKERLTHYWTQRHPEVRDVDGAGVRDTIARLHELKTAAYEAMVNDGAVSLRPGVLHLIDAAGRAGLHLAIATTTSPVNIAALLRGAIGTDWRQFFGIVEDASTAAVKKPHPQVYLQTLQRLQLPAAACLAFEDSANGLRAATGAGLATVITPTQFTADHDFSAALKVLPNLQGVTVADLQAWHALTTP
ncbi:MAG: HAD family hydrolase [Betaproteobacteria bacterium]|nr:HAD family hydrolase [Betaproteobacteria bacterium]